MARRSLQADPAPTAPVASVLPACTTRAGAAPDRGRAGLTLVELLLVMAIIGVVLGLGLGAFTALETPGRQTLGMVQSVLRAGSTQAVAHQATTRVGFDTGDPDGGRILPAEVAVVGTWHFEDESLRGAFGLYGDGVQHRLVDDGYIGKALSVARTGAEVRIRVQEDPAFDLADGFTLDVALRDNDGGGGRLLDVGRVIGLDVTPDGGLRGWIAPDHRAAEQRARAAGADARDGDGARRATHLFVESEPGTVLPGRWTSARLEYDRRRLRLVADGLPCAVLESDLPLRPLAGPLTISSADDQGFRGELDQLVVAALDQAEPIDLPDQAVFVAPTPPQVVFDAGGGLDGSVHDGPVEVRIRYVDGDERSVFVNPFGTVE